MKIEKVRKQEMLTKYHDQPKSQNPTYCFFFFYLYSLYIISLFLLRTSSYCTEKLEKKHTHIPYFYPRAQASRVM